MLYSTCFYIIAKYPHLGASPDGITVCNCHGKGLLEIKYPHKYRNSLKACKMIKIFHSLRCKFSYPYFYDFFIWTPLVNTNIPNALLVRVQRDADFIWGMVKKLNDYFFIILLPEIVTRRNVCLNNKQKNYCICKRSCFKPIIAYDRPNCEVEWYYYTRVEVTRASESSWVCPPC